MDNKLLLIKAITLLYRESLIETKKDNSADLVRTVLENIKVPEISIGMNREREIVIALKKTALEMCENAYDHFYEKGDLLTTLKLNCADESRLYETAEAGIDTEITETSIKRSVASIRASIQKHFGEQKVDELLNKAAFTIRHNRDKIKSVPNFISELVSQLEPFQISSQAKDPAIVGEIDIGNVNEAAAVFEEIKHMQDGTSLLKSGWQEFDRFLQGGLRRGEEVMLGALQHNYKTGFTLSWFAQIARHNKPMMIDPKKKPLLLRISFEDDLTNNMSFLYEYLKKHESEDPNVEQVSHSSNEEIAGYVKEKLQVNGYHIKMIRVDPSQWSYMHLCNKITELEADGYEIHLCMVDYLAMLPTTGCTMGPTGSDVRDMYRRVRNFMSPRKITFVTPHQLSTEAKQLIRDGRQNFVQEVQGKGYLDKCRTLDQELDLEMYIHIEKHQKKYYLTIQRGKHRGVPVLDDEFKYFVLPFPKTGPILEDVGKPNSAMRKLGGGPIGTVDEQPFWDFKDQI